MAMYNEITVTAELTNTEYMITKNYNLLQNKPQINSVELMGNKSLEDLGINPDAEENVIDTVKVNGSALTPDADKAVNVTVTTGSDNGTVKVNGSDVAVKGLKSAAFTEATAYDAAGSAAEVQGNVDALTVVVNGKVDKVQGKGLSQNDFTNAYKTKLDGIEAGAQVNTVTSVAGKTGVVTLQKSDVGLGNVDNTSDLNKPISTATQTALNGKVDKVAGKGLSQNDFTNELKSKLDGIESGAEVNVQADWNQTDSSADDYIKNKPSLVGEVPDLISGGSLSLVTPEITQNAPYIFRQTAGGLNNLFPLMNLKSIVGGTVAFNQLVDSGTSSVALTTNHKALTKVNGAWSVVNGGTIAVTGGTDMVIDLTQMFGSSIADRIYSLEQATAGSGVAYFRSLFPKDYYAYNAGQLMSVKALSHKMVGFNQWDEVWEVGSISNTTGQNTENANMFRSKNYIPIVAGQNYYFKQGTDTIGLRFYDISKNFISAYALAGNSDVLTYGTNKLPTNTAFMRFVNTSRNTYQNNICINLHWDGERDGEYEAYEEHTYPLDSDLELRGIPKLDSANKLYYDGDTYESDGSVTRKYGIVDLGSLNYTYHTQYEFFYTNISTYAKGSDNCICERYQYMGYSSDVSMENVANNTVWRAGSTSNQLKFKNTAYTDATAFKTAMSGVYLVYELTTPTTETADAFQNLQIVDDFGTEEFVDSRDVPIPVGNDTDFTQEIHIASLPTADGTYNATLTMSNGIATMSFVSTS